MIWLLPLLPAAATALILLARHWRDHEACQASAPPAAVLDFAPDGTVRGLYTEVLPLASLGRLAVERASRIEFDAASQAWQVRNVAGCLLFAHPSRATCLAWESTHPELLA